MEAVPKKRGRPPKLAIPGSAPVKREKKPKEVIPGSAPVKRGRPPKVQEPPPAPPAEKPAPSAPSAEEPTPEKPNYWKWRNTVEDLLRRHISDAIQKISQLKEIQEKGSTKEMRDVASKYMELLLKDFVYIIAEKLNEVYGYNTPDDDFQIYEDDDKYYLEDGKTIADLEKRMEETSSVETYQGYLTTDFDDKNIKVSFE
jgi:hypothetical protein